jgi:nucleotide-binding universal stress UspA family protein
MCEEARRLGARIIVVGNRRVQGASRVLGSIASDVAKQAPCDVLIVNTTGAGAKQSES